MATDLFDLSGKVALVTGASAGGLGYHSAVALAEHGADVFVADLENRAADLDQTVAAVQATGHRAAAGYCDVADEAQVDAMVTRALQAFGRIDILVHHAGVMLRKDAFDDARG